MAPFPVPDQPDPAARSQSTRPAGDESGAPRALDRDAFDTFVIRGLVPTLRPGDVVVLDNLSVHKSRHAQQAIKAAGARLVFLPAYSPDFNPIEQAFAKLRQGLRAAGAHSTETVMAATRELYPQITATDARGFYRHAGYLL